MNVSLQETTRNNSEPENVISFTNTHQRKSEEGEVYHLQSVFLITTGPLIKSFTPLSTF